MAMMTVLASGVNRNLPMPVRNTTGKNTTASVSVIINSGLATSIAPSRAASNDDLPNERWRSVFSMTTMDWSINNPTDAIHDGDRVRARLAVNGNIDLPLAVYANDVRLDLIGVFHVGDIANIGGRAVTNTQREVLQFGHRLHHAIG